MPPPRVAKVKAWGRRGIGRGANCRAAHRGRRRIGDSGACRNATAAGRAPAQDGTGDRASALAAAILGISESLDLDTVLWEVVEGARGLTGAGRGIVATVDASGAPVDHVFSGFAPGEEDELVGWSGGLRLFEHLHELPGPLRTEDLPSYVRELGLTPAPALPGPFQGTPVRWRGVGVGYLFLGDKAEAAPFTEADEEVLLLFAALAGAAIGNARAHASERRARLDLEALIETSPVGVVVFDGRTGALASSNREARRIVEGLRTPGRPLEELLDTVACRRADGRETSLAELPLAEQFANVETVRAEEVVLSVPDGRRRAHAGQRDADRGRGIRAQLGGGDAAGSGAAG